MGFPESIMSAFPAKCKLLLMKISWYHVIKAQPCSQSRTHNSLHKFIAAFPSAILYKCLFSTKSCLLWASIQRTVNAVLLKIDYDGLRDDFMQESRKTSVVLVHLCGLKVFLVTFQYNRYHRHGSIGTQFGHKRSH